MNLFVRLVIHVFTFRVLKLRLDQCVQDTESTDSEDDNEFIYNDESEADVNTESEDLEISDEERQESNQEDEGFEDRLSLDNSEDD